MSDTNATQPVVRLSDEERRRLQTDPEAITAQLLDAISEENAHKVPARCAMWEKIAMSTDEIDLALALLGAHRAFKEASTLQLPGAVIIFDSPAASAIGTTCLRFYGMQAWDDTLRRCGEYLYKAVIDPSNMEEFAVQYRNMRNEADADADRSWLTTEYLDSIRFMRGDMPSLEECEKEVLSRPGQGLEDVIVPERHEEELMAVATPVQQALLRAAMVLWGRKGFEYLEDGFFDMWEARVRAETPNADASTFSAAKEELLRNLNRQISDQLNGIHNVSWLPFYEYYWKDCGLEYASVMDGLLKLCKAVGWWVVYPGALVLQRRLAELHILEDGRQHCTTGPATRHRDGWAVYALNAVPVPAWAIETHPDDITVEQILGLGSSDGDTSNVEVRAEILRHIGMERFLKKASPGPIDTAVVNGLTYELHMLNLGKDADQEELHCPYLVMQNPSEPDKQHVEAVDRECRTVRDAILWRNGITADQVDEENGEDYYQQGDVLIKPRGARKLKPFPKQLT